MIGLQGDKRQRNHHISGVLVDAAKRGFTPAICKKTTTKIINHTKLSNLFFTLFVYLIVKNDLVART